MGVSSVCFWGSNTEPQEVSGCLWVWKDLYSRKLSGICFWSCVCLLFMSSCCSSQLSFLSVSPWFDYSNVYHPFPFNINKTDFQHQKQKITAHSLNEKPVRTFNFVSWKKNILTQHPSIHSSIQQALLPANLFKASRFPSPLLSSFLAHFQDKFLRGKMLSAWPPWSMLRCIVTSPWKPVGYMGANS